LRAAGIGGIVELGTYIQQTLQNHSHVKQNTDNLQSYRIRSEGRVTEVK